MNRSALSIVGIATLLITAGCSPLIFQFQPDHLAEGSKKSAKARILTRLCQWEAPSNVRYRLSTSSAWRNLARPTKTSGDIGFLKNSWWESPIPDSEQFRQGESYEVEWSIPYWGASWLGCPRKVAGAVETDRQTFTVTRPFAVSANPASVELPANGTVPLNVRVDRFTSSSSPVTVTISGLPAGVTASPTSVSVSGTSTVFTLSAAASTAPGPHSATLMGTAPSRTSQQSHFTVTVTRPSVTGVSPAKATRGSFITVQGTRFSANCANNYATFAGMNVVPDSCTASSLNLQVPNTAAYGPTQLSVTVNGVTTSSIHFSVARTPGSFVNITNNIEGHISSPRICSDGSVRLDVTGSYLASYRRVTNNAFIGALAFHADTPLMQINSQATPETWSGGGGAGFSLCSTGIVLDLNALATDHHVLAFRFLRLSDGTFFSKAFNYYTPINNKEYGSVTPNLYRSPDGTVFIAVVASDVGVEKKALVIDRQTGNTLDTVELGGIGGTFSAILTSSNTVIITFAGTTYTGIVIP